MGRYLSTTLVVMGMFACGVGLLAFKTVMLDFPFDEHSMIYNAIYHQERLLLLLDINYRAWLTCIIAHINPHLLSMYLLVW
jgi:hypothetical protein